MHVTDTVGDMLTRIRNASSAKHDEVNVPASKLKMSIADILFKEGYIEKYELVEDKKQGVIKIRLKYIDSKKLPVIMGLKRISKPGLRLYYKSADIPKVMKGLGIAIVSTSKGIVTDKVARAQKIGGEVLAFVW
jgi:small subunit ribosomal protein S8